MGGETKGVNIIEFKSWTALEWFGFVDKLIGMAAMFWFG